MKLAYFLAWCGLVLTVYARQLLEQAAAMGLLGLR